MRNSGGAERLRGAARVFALGFAAGALMFLFNRWALVKFPLNLALVGLLIYAGLGLAWGVSAAWLGRGALERRAPLLAVLIGAWLFGLLANENVTTHYLLGSVYYPYPLPPQAYLRVAGLLLAVGLSPAPLYAAGHAFGDALRRAPSGAGAYAWFALGLAAAVPAAHFSVLWLGVYAPAIAVCAVVAFLLPHRRAALIGLLLCGAAAWTSAHNKNESFYVWRIDEYTNMSTHWTPYYRLDFISFKDGRCVGGVYNTIMIWYACDSVEHYPTEMRRLMAELARGRERVLLAGRTDGLYAGMLLDANPRFRTFESVEFDPVVPRLMAGRYAEYNGRVFQRPGMSVETADLRQAIRTRADAGKQYDLIFQNGIGIRLFNMPRSVFLQEDYLTARENYSDIFNRLLAPGGVYVIDWGSSMEDEVYPMLANIPEGVSVRAFHIWIGEFPLSGLPLFYVVASRDKAQLDRIAERMLQMPTVREVKIDARQAAAARFGENRPIHHKPLAPGLLVLMLPFFIALVAATAHAGFREPWRMPVRPAYAAWYAAVLLLLYLIFFSGNMGEVLVHKVPMTHGTRALCTFLVLALAGFLAQYLIRSIGKWGAAFVAGRGRIATCCWFAGLGAGLAETYLHSRIARLYPGGPAYGMVWLGVICALGFAAFLAVPRAALARRTKHTALAALLMIPALMALESGALSLGLTSLLAWAVMFLAAVFWMGALDRVSESARPRALGLMLFGALAGMYLFQWLVAFLGYAASAPAAGFAFLFAALLFKISEKQFSAQGS